MTNQEQLKFIIERIGDLANAPEDFKSGLISLINQTGFALGELSLADFIKLIDAHSVAYQSRQPLNIAERCLLSGTGSITEKIDIISAVLAERAKHLDGADLANAIATARLFLQAGYSGATALLNGYRSLKLSAYRLQAA